MKWYLTQFVLNFNEIYSTFFFRIATTFTQHDLESVVDKKDKFKR